MDGSAPRKRGWPWGLMAFAALVGLADGAVMTWDHLAYLMDTHPVCGEGGGCAIAHQLDVTINRVPMPAGWPDLPLAILAVGCYGLVAWLLVRVWRKRSDDAHSLNYLWGLGVASFALSVFLAAYSLVVQGTLCPFCSVLYVASALLLVGAAAAQPKALRERVRALRASLICRDALVCVAVFLGVVAVAYLAFARPIVADQAAKTRALARSLPAQPRLPVSAEARPTLGPVDAPVHIIEFADYLCGHCEELYHALHELLETRPGKVRISVLNFPLGDCAAARGSCFAARAAECAFRQGAYEKFGRAAFEFGLPEDPEAKLKDLISRLGFEEASFLACMDDPTTLAQIKADRAQGLRFEITSTPTLFFNGRIVKGGLPLSALEQIVDAFVAEDAP